MAIGEQEIGDSPGGQESPFCVQLYATSMPVASRLIGMVPSEVTQSAMVTAPTSWAAAQMASPDVKTPVDVSPWTNATALGFSRRPGYATANRGSSDSLRLPHNRHTTVMVIR